MDKAASRNSSRVAGELTQFTYLLTWQLSSVVTLLVASVNLLHIESGGFPLCSNRQHYHIDVRLEDNREDY